jgi:hypothetical protein
MLVLRAGCLQGKECHATFYSPAGDGVVGVHVFAVLDWRYFPEKLKSRYADVAEKYTWIMVFCSPQ